MADRPGEFALVPIVTKSERARCGSVGLSKAVDRLVPGQPFFAAIYFIDLAIGKMPMAVIDVIAAAIRGDHQCVVPLRVEQRRQRVRHMMVIEVNAVSSRKPLSRRNDAASKKSVSRVVLARRASRGMKRVFFPWR